MISSHYSRLEENMAIYVFKCTCCEKESEVLTNNINVKFKKCPECGGEMEKMPAVSNFKINGYCYKNEYKK